MQFLRQLFRPLPLLLIALAGGGAVLAQIESGDRGVAPIDSSGSYEVSGVTVDAAGKTADEARLGGWREAQRKGWKLLWGRVNGLPPERAPGLSDSTLDSIVAGIIVENEQIGPRRYIAELGVLFDRARTGQLLGVHGQTMRSPPMLVIPVEWNASMPQSFEVRTEWQKAWARFRSGGSPIDYVRPVGSGADPLLLNDAQSRRPGRGWWRMLLDQYGAADIVVPEVRLHRLWPGGPVVGEFTAFHGPDRLFIDRFTLRVENSDTLPKMMDEGVRRIDMAYARALQDGRLQPDPSLVIEEPVEPELIEASLASDEAVTEDGVVATAFNVQIETPDASAALGAEAFLRTVPGVRSATTASLALGGVSVIRVGFEGDLAGLRIALAARGWRAEDAPGGLRIRRGGGVTPAVPPAAHPPPDAAANVQAD